MITSAKLRKKHDLLWYKINKYMAQLNRMVPNGKKTSILNSNWIETEQKMIEITFWCAHSEEMKCLSWVMPYIHIHTRASRKKEGSHSNVSDIKCERKYADHKCIRQVPKHIKLATIDDFILPDFDLKDKGTSLKQAHFYIFMIQ